MKTRQQKKLDTIRTKRSMPSTTRSSSRMLPSTALISLNICSSRLRNLTFCSPYSFRISFLSQSNNYAYDVSTYQFESSNESPIISHYKRKIIPSYLPLLFNFRGLTFQDFAEALALWSCWSDSEVYQCHAGAYIWSQLYRRVLGGEDDVELGAVIHVFCSNSENDKKRM